MKLEMVIHKIKCIDNLKMVFPIEKGLYAITGMNGSGKSTIVACASSVFFNMRNNLCHSRLFYQRFIVCKRLPKRG